MKELLLLRILHGAFPHLCVLVLEFSSSPARSSGGTLRSECTGSPGCRRAAYRGRKPVGVQNALRLKVHRELVYFTSL